MSHACTLWCIPAMCLRAVAAGHTPGSAPDLSLGMQSAPSRPAVHVAGTPHLTPVAAVPSHPVHPPLRCASPGGQVRRQIGAGVRYVDRRADGEARGQPRRAGEGQAVLYVQEGARPDGAARPDSGACPAWATACCCRWCTTGCLTLTHVPLLALSCCSLCHSRSPRRHLRKGRSGLRSKSTCTSAARSCACTTSWTTMRSRCARVAVLVGEPPAASSHPRVLVCRSSTWSAVPSLAPRCGHPKRHRRPRLGVGCLYWRVAACEARSDECVAPVCLSQTPRLTPFTLSHSTTGHTCRGR